MAEAAPPGEMEVRMRVRLVLVVGVGLLLWGCGDDGSSVIPDGGTHDGFVGDGGGGDAWACLALGEACTGAGDCCSLSCDLTTNTCSQGSCGVAGAACTVATDCCTLSCVGGICDAVQCTTTGEACGGNAECCTNNCASGACAAIVVGGCTTVGNACSGDTECCSLNCQGGRCAPSFVCAPIGDICYTGPDCCTGVCTIPSGLSAGTCGSIDVTGAGGCAVAGLPCTDFGQCCSRVCVPTSMGINVCQVTSGCRLQGELCTETAECCPGPDQSSQYGLMECNIMAGTDPPIGRCRNPTGCNPVGNVCGQGVNAPHDCCNCASPKIQCCHPDNSGVPRCFGGSDVVPCPEGYNGTPDCCIPVGGQCSFSSECCDGRPCVPDDQGVLRCGTGQCIPVGGGCTSTTDCCAGLVCSIPPGSLTGTCGTVVPPPDGGTPTPDGGTVQDDAGICALPGQHCTQTSDCCYGFTCYAPGGITACTPSDTGCTCWTIE
jgi:hypothetical protein